MSHLDELADLPPDEAKAILAGLSPEQLEAMLHDWPTYARPEQMPPKAAVDGGQWDTWLILAGRGFGKTRSGSEFIRENVCGPTPLARGKCQKVAIIGETAKDVRDVVIEGQSGILGVHPKAYRPTYEPSKARLTWPNGAIATLYNGTEPDQLRGPQFDLAWCDELAKWRYAEETWDMLQFGLRLGDHPQAVVTTTPRPIKLLKTLISDPRTVVTRGKTADNAENLAASFLAKMRAKYEGTRLGRQELSAELLEDDPNALWRRSVIDERRRRYKANDLPDMLRVVVAVDIAAKAVVNQTQEGGAETGIVVCGLGTDGRGYTLADESCEGGPNEWGRRAVSAFDLYMADAVIVETNNGGDMIAFVLRSVRPDLPIKEVTASRGKVTRAEPVAALYEQGRISHVGSFPVLEDQMCSFNNIDVEKEVVRKDRVDALVWGFSDLFPQIIAKKEKPWKDKWSGRGGRAWRRRAS